MLQAFLYVSGSLPPNFFVRNHTFSMRDWLTIQYEKDNDPRLKKFIQANPGLDMAMRTLLGKALNLSQPSVENWIQSYQYGASECLQIQINHSYKCQ